MIIDSGENKFVELICKIPNVAIQGYDKNRRVIYWNEASASIYGFTKDEAIGKKIEELIVPEFMKEDVISHITNWYNKGNVIPSGIISLQHKNGSIVHVYSSHIMLGEDTEYPEMFCVDVNLSEQKKQEEILKKQEKILAEQSKMASMGEMLENIAHQWRQPLSVISTLASSIDLKNDYEILKKDEITSSMNNINFNVEHLSSTIDDFRSFYKSNKIKKEFKIQDVFDKTFKLASSQFHKSEITIIEEIEDITYNGFENELIQVIMNVINNARDELMEKDNHRLLLIDASLKDTTIEVNITDNAGGIKEDILPRVFDAHFTTKADTTGTGIGLYMSKIIIDEHLNGSITAKNLEFVHSGMPYTGARFSLILPIY